MKLSNLYLSLMILISVQSELVASHTSSFFFFVSNSLYSLRQSIDL